MKSGLNLSFNSGFIVFNKAIIEKHNGSIKLDNEFTTGTQFIIEL